jgi:threonine/homoserine/homoserine lactone efflux protein
MSPGPSLAVLLRNTMEGGKTRGVSCGIGHGIGFGIYAFVAIAGISQLKASASEAAIFLELSGGLFLLFLAAMMLKGSDEEFEHKYSSKRGFTEGFLIAFLNPKILVFLIAIFSQFIEPDFTWTERLLIASIALLIDGGWYILVALIISETPILSILKERARGFEITMATVLAGLGVWILFGIESI